MKETRKKGFDKGVTSAPPNSSPSFAYCGGCHGVAARPSAILQRGVPERALATGHKATSAQRGRQIFVLNRLPSRRLARPANVRLVERPGVAGRDVRALVLAEQLAVVVRQDSVVVRSDLCISSIRRRDLHAGLELVLVVGAPSQESVDGRLVQSSRFCDGRVVGRQARLDTGDAAAS